jgi:UDP-N-acetyl-D-mannosaminuronic acid dehydrogenase
VFDLTDAIVDRGGTPVVADPLYTDEELARLGLDPWTGGAIDAVIVQSDHVEYSTLDPGDLPGAQVVFDGRGVLDPGLWAGSAARVMVIGQGSNTP